VSANGGDVSIESCSELGLAELIRGFLEATLIVLPFANIAEYGRFKLSID